MSLQSEKYALIEVLIKVEDIKIVDEIKAMLLNSNKVLGFDANGNAISTSQMKSDIVAAKERIASGKFTTQEDLENEVENW
jgi:hypothetical protein